MSNASSVESRYFSGQQLYGDDFSQAEIDAWFADEEHGYAGLVNADEGKHAYGYDALNLLHGYSRLPPGQRFNHVLGFGSSYGDELLPIVDRCHRVTLLDASSKFSVKSLAGVPVEYLLAQSTGKIALPDASVDLMTCFGVLHHIPNVSQVVREFRRIMAPDGIALIREPTTTMGDWRKPRSGLTKRERGIPRDLFVKLIEDAGFAIVSARDCQFPPWVRVLHKLRRPTFSSAFNTQIDSLLATFFRFNYTYHRGGVWSRFAPGSLYIMAVPKP